MEINGVLKTSSDVITTERKGEKRKKQGEREREREREREWWEESYSVTIKVFKPFLVY